VTQAGSFLAAYYIGPGLLGPLAAGMVVALLLLIPVRERATATS
jgi:hypothetical protein